MCTPILNLQSWHSREFLGVACYQGGPQAQGLSSNEGIQGANRHACVFENGAYPSVDLNDCVVYWKYVKGCKDGREQVLFLRTQVRVPGCPASEAILQLARRND